MYEGKTLKLSLIYKYDFVFEINVREAMTHPLITYLTMAPLEGTFIFIQHQEYNLIGEH